MNLKAFAKSVFYLYYDGFRSMKLGKKLWAIIFIKLFLFFVVIKLLFFPNILQEKFSNDKQRANFVLEQLTSRKD